MLYFARKKTGFFVKVDDLMSDFPQILKTLRRSRKVTQSKLAEALGYGCTAIANYESGRTEPDIDTLLKIANFFEVPVGSLLERENKIYKIDEEVEFVIQKFSQLDREKKDYLLYTLNIL